MRKIRDRGHPHRQHDRSHRMLFSHARTIQDLLRGFIHERWVRELDYQSLERLPTDYISGQLAGDFEERAGDVVWRVDWRDPATGSRSLYIVILLEFQSACEEDMALRMLVYVGLFYQGLLKEQPLRRREKLPPVLPIVMYNGDPDWSAPLDVAELIEPGPQGLDDFRPSMRYCLIDEKRWPASELEGLENVVAGIFRVVQNRGPEDVSQTVGKLRTWLAHPDQRMLRRDIAAWLSKVALPAMLPGVEIPELRELDDFYTVMEANMPTWTEQWYNEGLEAGVVRGEAKGEAKVILRLLERKFGPLKPRIKERIQSAKAEQLLEWTDRLLGAERLEEVFGTA